MEATFARATMPPPCERNGETATSRGHRAASVMETHRCRSVNGGGIKVFFCVCFTIGAMTVFSRMRKVCSVVFDLERIALAFYHFECRRPQIIGFFFAVARVTRDASDLNLQLVSGRAPTLNMCIHPRFLWCFKRLSADERIDRFAATCDFQVDLSKVDPD